MTENRSGFEDDITRRQWILRLGEVVVLAGISGVLPEGLAMTLSGQDTATATLPPGLYLPSSDHLVHALQSGAKTISAPRGSETEYASPNSTPFRPAFLSGDELAIINRFVEIVLGGVDANALSDTVHWLDLWLSSAGGVLQAAQNLSPLHRELAVAYYGAAAVHDLESTNPQMVVREGVKSLQELSIKNYGLAFVDLPQEQQASLMTSLRAAGADSPLRKFFDSVRGEAIRGYYTSAEGLKELDYKGNAYYAECPGCPAAEGERASHLHSDTPNQTK